MKLSLTSLFSGIGGLEYGFHERGANTLLFCDNDPASQEVLKANYPHIPIHSDVTKLKSLPSCEILLAGFPCQDLSQAGSKAGIEGSRSGLVSHLFRLIRKAKPAPKWIIVENVPYMLSLGKGAAMHLLTSRFEEMGYQWCYRTVDARSFGLPQRRPRVLFVASRTEDPRAVLLPQDAPQSNIDGKPSEISENLMYGFYWTEGSRGVGWAKESVPPIKGGSTIGIPSPPAVWIPKRDYVGTVSLRDAERLQGFPADWTAAAELNPKLRKNSRWRLVGNAVNTGMSSWLAGRILEHKRYDSTGDSRWEKGAWPTAAWGFKGEVFRSNVSLWPVQIAAPPLSKYLIDPLKPLSRRATEGFLSRARVCTNIVYSERFLASLEHHASLQ